jgi:hypothetical protein
MSTAKYAVVSVPRPQPTSYLDGQQLGVIDLSTGMLRVIDTGTGESLGGWISPDQTKVLIEQQIGTDVKDLIVDLTSGESTELTANGLSRAYPIWWTPDGIIFGSASGVLKLDPPTLAVTRIDIDGQVRFASPNGNYVAGEKQVNPADPRCSDGIFMNRLDWTAVASAARLSPGSSIASPPNRALNIVDIADDGSIVYNQGHCLPSAPAPSLDTGLYYFSQGRATQQFMTGNDYWSGKLLGNSFAVLNHQTADATGKPTGVELDLVKLCISEGCRPTVTTIAGGDASVHSYAFSVVPHAVNSGPGAGVGSQG